MLTWLNMQCHVLYSFGCLNSSIVIWWQCIIMLTFSVTCDSMNTCMSGNRQYQEGKFWFPENLWKHRRTGRCNILAIATWAAWFWAAQGWLLTKKKEERKGSKGCFNIFATAGLRTQSVPVWKLQNIYWFVFNRSLYCPRVNENYLNFLEK